MNDDARFRDFGLTARALGLQDAIKVLQKELDATIEELDGRKPAAADEPMTVRKAIGRPRKVKPPKPGMLQSGWPADPEERKAEARRRFAARSKKFPKVPDVIENMRRAGKASWARLSPRQKKARVAKMVAARRANKDLPAVSLAIAS